MEELVEFLRNYFSVDDKLNRFNNSEILTMSFLYTFKKSSPFWFSERENFPYKVSNKELAIALKSILNVPFTLSVGREHDNTIGMISVTRVFM